MLKTAQEKTCNDITAEQLAESVLEDNAAQLAADIFKTLGDPTRLKIITLLLDHEVCVHTIADTLKVSQSAVSHQLRVMRQLRLVRFRKEGRHVYYRLDDEHIHNLIKGALDHIQHQ
ncbi:MAG: transcriptional regulator [Anaerolineaceae bacterium]|nr:transcriptional regulator [Anaerolineaceae bacterium]